jgi:hypothetical protein
VQKRLRTEEIDVVMSQRKERMESFYISTTVLHRLRSTFVSSALFQGYKFESEQSGEEMIANDGAISKLWPCHSSEWVTLPRVGLHDRASTAFSLTKNVVMALELEKDFEGLSKP